MSRTSVVCEEADFRGLISLGENNIVHPKCRIVGEGSGLIIIGNNNIFEENCSIVNRSSESIIIGDENILEVGCVFEGSRLGNGCIIEAKASVARGTTIGNNCVIGTMCSTQKDEDIPDDTVIFGAKNERRTQTKATKAQYNLHMRHLEYLREVLPKYHHKRTLR